MTKTYTPPEFHTHVILVGQWPKARTELIRCPSTWPVEQAVRTAFPGGLPGEWFLLNTCWRFEDANDWDARLCALLDRTASPEAPLSSATAGDIVCPTWRHAVVAVGRQPDITFVLVRFAAGPGWLERVQSQLGTIPDAGWGIIGIWSSFDQAQKCLDLLLGCESPN